MEQALEESAPALSLWRTVRAHAPAPAFSGGVMDSWPAWAVDALAVLNEEHQVCRAYFAAEQRKQQEKERRHA